MIRKLRVRSRSETDRLMRAISRALVGYFVTVLLGVNTKLPCGLARQNGLDGRLCD